MHLVDHGTCMQFAHSLRLLHGYRPAADHARFAPDRNARRPEAGGRPKAPAFDMIARKSKFVREFTNQHPIIHVRAAS